MSSQAWAIIGGVGATFVRLLGWRVGFGLGVLVLWELAAGCWIDPFWFSSPLRIARHLDQFDTTGAVGGIVVLMVCGMLFNGMLNRLERYVLRWRPRERAAAARELQ